MKQLNRKHYAAFVLAFVVGLVVVLFVTPAAFAAPPGDGAVLVAGGQPVVVATAAPVYTRPIIRTWRTPRVIVPQAAPVVVTQPIIQRPQVTVVQAPLAPPRAFAVQEVPREPFAVRGIFTDRIRIPRGVDRVIVPLE